MKKHIAIMLFLGLIVSSAPAYASANEVVNRSSVTVKVEGQEIQFDQHPIIVNDFTLVPLRNIFEALGAEVNWDVSKKEVTAKKDSVFTTLKVGSKHASKNGLTVSLDVEPRIVNGRTLVPLRFVSETLGSTVTWDGKTRTIDIMTPIKKAEENGKTLTYENALHMALKNSAEYKNLESQAERSQEVQQKASDNVKYTPVGIGQPNDLQDQAARGYLQALLKANVDLEKVKKDLEDKKDVLAYSVRLAYHEVLQKKAEWLLSDLNQAHLKQKRDQTKVKAQFGMMSEFELTQAEANYKEAQEKQQLALKALDQSYLKLNQLLGLTNDSRYELVEQPAFNKLEEVNLDEHIRKLLNESTAIWYADEMAKLAEQSLSLYSHGGQESYRTKEIDANIAQTTANDAKKKFDEGTRSLYSSIRQLENQYNILLVNLSKAEEAQKLVKIKLDLGMATATELSDASIAVEQLKKNLLDIAINLDHMKITFEKPWVSGR